MIKINKYGQSNDVETGRAMSIQQPFVEQILVGNKKTEYRSSGNLIGIRGRVYLYASKTLRPEDDYQRAGYSRGNLATGLIVGSVEIVGCFIDDNGDTNIQLKNPLRYEKPLVPENPGQPLFFFPFGPSRSPRKGPKIVLTPLGVEKIAQTKVITKRPKKKFGPVIPSPELADIIGDNKITRATMVLKLKKYITKNRLMKSDNKSIVYADKKLKKITKKSPFSIFELPSFVKNYSRS